MVAVELRTADVKTNGGVPYDQSYVWHMAFNGEGLVREVRVWMDTAELEKVLGGEIKRQAQLRISGGEKNESVGGQKTEVYGRKV